MTKRTLPMDVPVTSPYYDRLRSLNLQMDFVLVGTQAEQKKYIGNAVEVNMSRVLCEALSEKLRKVV